MNHAADSYGNSPPPQSPPQQILMEQPDQPLLVEVHHNSAEPSANVNNHTQIHVDPSERLNCLRTLAKFIGPGYMIAVGYMDPGNWATDIGGGAQFGYRLLFVVLMSSLAAMLFQYLCVKMAVVTGQDLAMNCRRILVDWRPLNWTLYALAETAIVATDLAEIIGSAIALNLLFRLPLIWGVVVTVADVLLVLQFWKQGNQRSNRIFELAILVLVVVVAICFIVLLHFTQPSLSLVFQGFIPTGELFTNPRMMYMAIGILGATIMPHNLYLHSSLAINRRVTLRPLNENATGIGSDAISLDDLLEEKRANLDVSLPVADPIVGLVEDRLESTKTTPLEDPEVIRLTLYYATWDCVLALLLALCINSLILIVGASAFWASGKYDVQELQDAFHSLNTFVGNGSGYLFAFALMVSGQTSTITGTMAGQVVMSGFLQLRFKPWLRRLVTRLLAIVPAMVTVLVYGEAGLNHLLVLTQVILSLQLPFAIIPLIYVTSSNRWMVMHRDADSRFVNGWLLTVFASILTVLIICMNGFLVFEAVISASS